MDRRTKYTKKIIKDTLIKLLSEKDIKKVTVSEICKLADVNRATFYRYYLDVYDLLDKIEEDFINELKQPYLEDPSRVNSVGAFSKEILAVFLENKDLVRILFNTNNNIYFLNEVLEVAYNMCKAKWMSDIPTITEDEIDVSLVRLMKARFELGEMDEDVEWNNIPYSVVNSPEHQALALKMAQAIQLLNVTGFDRSEAVSIVSKVIGEVEMPSDMSSIFAQSSNDPQEKEKLENEKQVGTQEPKNTTGVPTDKETGKTV